MFKKKHMVAVLGIVSVFLGGFFFSNALLAQGSGEYDPWLDYNEDGIIDVNDLHPLGQSYGSSGEPTKNVNVTNWPASREIGVWWNKPVPPSDWSDVCSASGFSDLHMIAYGSGLTGSESMLLKVYGHLWNPGHNDYFILLAYEILLNATSPFAFITIPVPSETFQFEVSGGTGYISLSYLTLA